MRLLLNVLVAGTLAASADIGSASDAEASGRSSRTVPRVAPAALDTVVREHRGVYETGFEMSWFHPCDAPPGDDTWWVTLTDAALRQRDSLAATLPKQSGAVFVRWRGTTSMKMPAGHMGRGTRYMLVSEVLELRAAGETACATT
jgi:hypothetical protein